MVFFSRGRKQAARPSVTAVIAAGGTSSRMGGEDKLFLLLRGIPVLAHTLLAFERADSVDSIVVVTRPESIVLVQDIYREFEISKLRSVIAGGATRAHSVMAGVLEAGDAAYVAVHDGARPLIPDAVIRRAVEAGIASGAVVPAVPVRDTIKVVEEGFVRQTPKREKLFAAQTPQVFQTGLLKGALTRVIEGNLAVTDDAAAVESMGMSVQIVEGDARNIKITAPEDILLAEALLYEEEDV
ncbi:2-C-methyl-D-erythritol 4-phosphate cytidylyltransferase [Oscillospiraceae bacterium OttesenSCG-928-F05]|nr:2-C-methyl-D-erythritol 4-phosphate cytidylyltransferase [Oscillospiraceae bacterium OttesenSCG-928-F05]